MKKQLKFRNILLRFKGLFSIGISDVIGGGVSSLFWLYMATLLEVEKYGEIFYLLSIINIVVTISLIGSKNTLFVYVSKNIKLDSALFFIAIIFGSITSLIILLIYYDLGLSLYVIGAVIFGLATSEILGKKLYVIYAKYLIAHKILSAVLSIGLYYWIGADGIILGMALSLFAYITIIIKTFKTTKINFSLLRSRFRFLINSYATDIIGTLGKQSDKLVIAPLLGFTLLGNYQLGIQFISVFQLLPMIVLKYTLPHDATGNPNKNLKITTVLISICFTVLIIVIAPSIIQIFFKKFIYVIEVIRILSLSLVPISISSIYTSKFLGSEHAKIILIYTILYLSSFLLFVLIIGNTLGVVGIAIAYVMTVTVTAIFFILVDLKNKISKT